MLADHHVPTAAFDTLAFYDTPASDKVLKSLSFMINKGEFKQIVDRYQNSIDAFNEAIRLENEMSSELSCKDADEDGLVL